MYSQLHPHGMKPESCILDLQFFAREGLHLHFGFRNVIDFGVGSPSTICLPLLRHVSARARGVLPIRLLIL